MAVLHAIICMQPSISEGIFGDRIILGHHYEWIECGGCMVNLMFKVFVQESFGERVGVDTDRYAARSHVNYQCGALLAWQYVFPHSFVYSLLCTYYPSP